MIFYNFVNLKWKKILVKDKKISYQLNYLDKNLRKINREFYIKITENR